MLLLFIQGFIIGIVVAAPVGPIGLLCINKTLNQGLIAGFSAGLGAALADTIYGLMAAYGLTFITDFLVEQVIWIRLLGSIFLIYLGIRLFSQKANTAATFDINKNHLHIITSTFFLTITNPMTILAFLAIFSGIGLSEEQGYYDASALVSGVFIGSLAWWLSLSGAITLVKHKLSQSHLRLINQLSGLILLLFSAWMLLKLVY